MRSKSFEAYLLILSDLAPCYRTPKTNTHTLMKKPEQKYLIAILRKFTLVNKYFYFSPTTSLNVDKSLKIM